MAKTKSSKIFNIIVILAASTYVALSEELTCKGVQKKHGDENATYCQAEVHEPVLAVAFNKDDILDKFVGFEVLNSTLTKLPTFSDENLKFTHFVWIKSVLATITPNSLDKFIELVEINLEQNALTYIESSTFEMNVKLTKVNLSGNKITNIDSDVFNNLEMLQAINLNDNDIWELNATMFRNNKNLEHIDLGINNIKKLPVTIFHGLNDLKTLNLEYNDIETLPDHILVQSDKLGALDISNNNIAMIGQQNLAVFQKLDRSNLKIFNNPCIKNDNDDLETIVKDKCAPNFEILYQWLAEEMRAIKPECKL